MCDNISLFVDCKQDGHTPDRKPADRKADRKQRGRRQWELWSVEDKQIFFGGLYEVNTGFTLYKHDGLAWL